MAAREISLQVESVCLSKECAGTRGEGKGAWGRLHRPGGVLLVLGQALHPAHLSFPHCLSLASNQDSGQSLDSFKHS